MELIANIIQAVLDAWEILPEQLTAVEIIPVIHAPGEWAVHVEPEMPYWALVSYRSGEYWVSTHDYIIL